jgi:hypothetical protein
MKTVHVPIQQIDHYPVGFVVTIRKSIHSDEVLERRRILAVDAPKGWKYAKLTYEQV